MYLIHVTLCQCIKFTLVKKTHTQTHRQGQTKILLSQRLIWFQLQTEIELNQMTSTH